MTIFWKILSFTVILIVFGACGPKVKVRSAQATKVQVIKTISTISTGTVEADQSAVLSFGSSGRVSKISVKVGDQVKTGSVLAQTENTDLLSIFEEAQSDLSRSDQLYKEGLISKAGLDSSRKNLAVARSNYSKTLIKAPFDGLVTEVNLELGEIPTTKSPVRLVDLKPRKVKGDIDEVDLAKVKVGTKARIKIPAIHQGYLDAEVIQVVPFVSSTKEQDRTSQVEFKLVNNELRPPVGASADIEIITDVKEDALAVPTRSLMGTGKARFLYIIREGKVTKTDVVLGLGNYDRTEIIKGVSLGDFVAIPNDDSELKDGIKVEAKEIKWP